jgi:hypothetical protein
MIEDIKVVKVQDNLKEEMARFAHEGLPYMTGDENWFDFNKTWAINIWWNWETMQYRATAYRIINGSPYIGLGIDLF